MEFLTFLPAVDVEAIAIAYGPWAAFTYFTVCKAASIYCNNTETKDTKLYKAAEYFADLHKKAKQ